MCGIMQSGCRFTEVTPSQFSLTKQLVLRIALPHVSLLALSVGYAILGSWILTSIKYRDGTDEILDQLDRAKKSFYTQLTRSRWHSSWMLDAGHAFTNFSDTLHSIYREYPQSPSVIKKILSGMPYSYDDPMSNVTWNLFFAATTLTSIGYGANAPNSVIGRLFIVVYILFGIPLYLITIADMAKFCTEGMNRTYTEVLKYKFQIQRKYRRWKSGRKRRESVAIGEIIIAGGYDEVAEFLWAHLENTHFVEVPFVLIYSVLLLYVLIATYLMSRIEGWSCYDGFYFVMTSVLTIGFGDLIPTNQRFILITLFIILVGLVLMTTSIDVVGAYYIDRLHFFGRRFETQDPLAWLKAVQQKRIRAMKREAMRKLFETVTALQHLHFGSYQNNVPSDNQASNNDNPIKLPEPPRPPHSLTASNATAESVLLKWEPPVLVDERRKYWYTLTYKTRTPQLRYNPMTVIDFITTPYYEVRSLQSFTLYEFSVVTTTRYGCSKSIKCQEYTEPCTVPQSLRLVAISAETATFSWKAPRKNNGAESYVILFAQEPAPQFHYWKRYRCGKSKKFTITDLSPDTRYIMCVSAAHNFGLAAMSKSLRFTTKKSWFDDELSIPLKATMQQVDSTYGDVASIASTLR